MIIKLDNIAKCSNIAVLFAHECKISNWDYNFHFEGRQVKGKAKQTSFNQESKKTVTNHSGTSIAVFKLSQFPCYWLAIDWVS